MGKLPPQAVELEEAVLGALLIEEDAHLSVTHILGVHSFYRESHQRIYSAILALLARSEPVDIRTVTHHLQKTGEIEIIGGSAYLIELTMHVNSSANIEAHARIIEEQSLRRQLIRAASQILRDGYDLTRETFDVLESAQQAIFSLTSDISQNQYTPFAQQVDTSLRHMVEGIRGVDSRYQSVNALLGKYENKTLTIYGARPGMGKSLLGTNEAIEQASRGVIVVRFSLEMSADQENYRALAHLSGVELEKIRRNQLSEVEAKLVYDSATYLKTLPIYQYDMSSLTVQQLRNIIRKIRLRHSPDAELIIYVDYLQLMDSSDGANWESQNDAIGAISRGLKTVAKDFNVPVVAFCQLSRAVETRGGDKRPTLSDIRASGQIEQDADVVCFLYRPEYYGISKLEDGTTTSGLLQIIFAKNRSGSLDTLNFWWQPEIAQISENATTF